MAPHRTQSRLARLLVPVAALALLTALVFPGGAPARVAGRHTPSSHRSCASNRRAGHHSRHAAAHGCAKHSHKDGSHKSKKPPAQTPVAAGQELAPARCEDGTLPTRAGTTWSCEDGSSPSCEEGAPLHASASATPMCAVKASKETECSRETGECAELACEDATEASAPEGCEHEAPEEPESEE